ncbi:MAG: hypothetical protein IIC95_10860 [Chloroflexi bacterium]|nr:hypothetical protein [Chloroflexota bacterium]MCH7656460.1 hypothetical protein [Chloroflexota bacterium]
MARVEPAVQSGSLLKLYQAMWAPYYQAVLSILGPTGVILPIGDPHHGQPNATTFTTKGEERLTFTWSEPPASFDTPLDLTDADSFQGVMPVVVFNGTDEEADSPDAAYWSRVGAAFSLCMWVNLSDVTPVTLLSKWDDAGGTNEWKWQLGSGGVPALRMHDESASAELLDIGSTALVSGEWTFFAVTIDGAETLAGVIHYINGALDAEGGGSIKDGGYVAMEDLAGTLKLLHEDATPSALGAGRVAGGPLGPCFTQKELTDDEVRALYDLGRAALAL